MLKQLDAFQEELAKDDRVASVVGPGDFRAETKDLGKLPTALKDSTKLLKGGKKDLGKLEDGLGQAGAGALTLQQGLRDAASGAAQLQSGSGDAEAGAGKRRAGLDAARSGALQISGGLGQALAGATALRDGAAKALAGSRQISGGLGQAAPTVKNGLPVIREMAANVAAGSQAVDSVTGQAQSATTSLDEALSNLQAMQGVSDDPSYQAAVAAVRSARDSAGNVSATLGGVQGKMQSASSVAGVFAGQVAELSDGLGQLLAGSTQLTSGIAQLSKGNADLADGIDQLNTGGGDLTAGLTQLRDGAGALESGLGLLTNGTGQLGSGLQAGTGPVGTLADGLATMESGVAKFRGNLPSSKDLEQLQAQAPGLFYSGYFVLAAIDGATPGSRNQATFAVNLERGGTAGQIVVIAKQPPSSEVTQELGDDLSVMAESFGDRVGLQTAVGGPGGALGDFQDDLSGKIWPVVIAVSLAIMLLVMVMLRAVVLPLVAVAFNLLTAAATFGIVSAVFVGDDPLMGGPGYLDPVTIIMTFACVFGFGIVFELYLLQQAREAFLASGDARDALRIALRRTAAASTGMAIAGVAVSVPFIASDMINLQQAGVAVAASVLLGALIVRPVLLPAAMQVLGRWVWWPTTRSAPPAPPSNGHRPHLPHLRRPKEPAEV
jgi:RND superfamily putative drug exporter